MNNIIQNLINSLPEGKVKMVQVGYFWTLVCVKVNGREQCGLAASMHNSNYEHNRTPAVQAAGRLQDRMASELAEMALAESLTERAIGMAAINALLPRYPEQWRTANAEEVILEEGRDKRVAVVGHFPFIEKMRDEIKSLSVLELAPRPGDLPASAAPDVLPQADLVAITATTLTNDTLDDLLMLCRPDARVMLLGPTTPLSPLLYNHGIHFISGAVVEDVNKVSLGVTQAASFRQLSQMGVRLVTMQKAD
ncbi:MAG: DUF364 domain-containing protein [Anaerolineae bacterium]|nr:DUF364 domain-containing protein [Anaerolineae bacterium]